MELQPNQYVMTVPCINVTSEFVLCRCIKQMLDIKKQVAISLGININNVYNLKYNNKNINLRTEENMKI